jgi:dTDP-glucose 4,6-dehydratase
MRLLITGGLGFIGSHFVRYILNKYPDYSVTNLDAITYAGNSANLKDVENNPNYRFIKGDICLRSSVKKAIRSCDAVINFAAQTHVDRSIVDAGTFVKTDVYGTYVLLEQARKYGIEKAIHVSTDEVYGSLEKGSFKETDPLNPSSPYAASKAGADLLAIAYYKTYNFPAVVTRSSNCYGSYQHPEKLIPKLIIKALLNEPLPIYGDGRNVRDWLHVMDNCEAIDLVLHYGEVGEVYNIAAGEERTNIEMAEMILKLLNKPNSLVAFVRDRPGHDRRYSLDCSKIRKLGWKPKTRFEEGLKKTVDWYASNEWWWKPLLGQMDVTW